MTKIRNHRQCSAFTQTTYSVKAITQNTNTMQPNYTHFRHYKNTKQTPKTLQSTRFAPTTQTPDIIQQVTKL